MNYEITRAAARDIRDILRETIKTFGARQFTIYRQLIESAIQAVAEQPHGPGSLDRADLAAGVRLWHLELTAGRRGGAAHCLYYRTGPLRNGTIGVIIARVLHEHMEPRHKVVRSLKTL